MSEKRLDYLDVAKGIAILLVILGHCCVTFDPERGLGMLVNPWLKIIYSFHMPLFFVAAGIVSRPRSGIVWWTVLRNDFNSLLVPYAIFALIYMPFSLTNIGRMLYGTTQMIRSSGSPCTQLWFLPCLFVARQLMFFVLNLSLKARQPTLVCLVSAALSFAVGLLLPPLKYGYPLGCNTALVAVGFMLVGYIIREQLSRFDGKSAWFQVLLAVPAAVALWVGNSYGMTEPGFVGMYISHYGPVFWFFVNAFAGIVLVRALSSLIAKIDVDSGMGYLRRSLTWIGRNTLWIFFLHMPSNLLFLMPWMERTFSLQRGRILDSLLMSVAILAYSVVGTILIKMVKESWKVR